MRTAIILTAVFLLACGPSVQNGGAGSDISLDVVPTDVRAGATAELVLANETSGSIGYNLCTSALERRTAGGWEGVQTDRVCTMELRKLPAGEATRYPYELPTELDEGEYRLLATVELMDEGGRQSVWTDPFTLEP